MKKFFSAALILMILFSGCSWNKKKADSKSMEQIHKESGVPVTVRTLVEESFSTVLTYATTLKATSEATAYAAITDVVETVGAGIGEYVQKDQVIIGFPKTNPQMNYYQAKAAYENAKATHERMKNLYEHEVISKQEYDNADAAYQVAKANWQAVNEVINVKAPISGYITQLYVHPSSNVAPGTPLFTVSNLERMEAQVWVPETEIARIRRGQIGMLEWDGKRFEGKVTKVNMVMDPAKKAFDVRVEFPNGERLLTSGITTNIRIETYRSSAIVVARQELVKEDGKYFAYVVEDNKAQKRPVTIGKEQGLYLEITSGLKPGERLISQGNELVADGTLVRIVSAK